MARWERTPCLLRGRMQGPHPEVVSSPSLEVGKETVKPLLRTAVQAIKRVDEKSDYKNADVLPAHHSLIL